LIIKEVLAGVLVNILTFIFSIIIIGLIIYFGLIKFIIPLISNKIGGYLP